MRIKDIWKKESLISYFADRIRSGRMAEAISVIAEIELKNIFSEICTILFHVCKLVGTELIVVGGVVYSKEEIDKIIEDDF